MNDTTKLKRSISLPLLILYGLGTMVGGGIYALTGKVVAQSGVFAPLAFLIAAVIASFTAISYSKLASKFPKSAGEAFYLKQAFNSNFLANLMGWLVILSGIISSATLAKASANLLQASINLPDIYIITGLIVLLSLIVIWGITESVLLISIITIIEIIGLFVVILLAFDKLLVLPDIDQFRNLFDFQQNTFDVWLGIFTGALIAFYAYIGFEDLVNIAEEVKNPTKNLTLAIIGCLIATFVLYALIAIISIRTVPVEILAKSPAPLAAILKSQNYYLAPGLLSLVSLLAITNGAVVQIIMASRVMYGLVEAGNAPKWLSDISPVTQTPIKATLLAMGLILVLVWFFDVIQLAKITSSLIFVIFIGVNVSLIKLLIIQKAKIINYFMPTMGALLSLLMLGFAVWSH